MTDNFKEGCCTGTHTKCQPVSKEDFDIVEAALKKNKGDKIAEDIL